ncbi:MAG: patatin-like phospholipase family protein [candidate division FCPU426 bacterium]
MTSRYRRCGLSLLLILSLVAGGCATTPPKPKARKQVALVLGGGGARGFAHVGVIRELESAGIPIDMIVGVSVGSLIGALYADTADSFKLEWKSFKIEKNQIFDFKVLNVWDGLAKGEALMAYLDKNLDATFIEDLKIPLAIVAADLYSGQPVVFRSGLIKNAVRASTSVPGIFAPVPFEDKLLVDGGVLGNLAPKVARDMGADIVIGVDIGKGRTHFADSQPNALLVILESIDLMGTEIVRLRQNEMDFVVKPDVGQIGITDFSHKQELIEAGRAAVRPWIGKIKRALE